MKADLDLVKNIIDELIIILVSSCQLQAFEILISHCMIGSKIQNIHWMLCTNFTYLENWSARNLMHWLRFGKEFWDSEEVHSNRNVLWEIAFNYR